MVYKTFKDIQLSALGLGCMRLPTVNNEYGNIDQAQVEEMVKYALDSGINYFDTAWGYHNGNSETAVGEALHHYPRNSFYLASKFPGYDTNNFEKKEEIFARQLEKCQVEYFDFYLMHNVCETNIAFYLDAKYSAVEYFIEQKKLGKIRHLGFSAHASYDVLKKYLEVYGKEMEFCQLQINYLDYDFQDAKRRIELVESYNIPVWVMEPVRGGKLASLSESQMAKLNALRPGVSAVEWAFRFIQSIKSVTMTLSGMSNFEQLKQNIKIYETDAPATEEERKVLFEIAHEMTASTSLPCTGCRYCTKYCPKGLNIPEIISFYNQYKYENGGFLAVMYVNALPGEKRPSSCIGCKSCERVCPQGIKVSEMMKDYKKAEK